MGLQSHSRRARLAKVIIAPPVAPGKRACQGEIFQPGRHYIEWEPTRPGVVTKVARQWWVDDHIRPCRNPCSTFVTEVNYCAHHMPVEWVVIANARVELWNQLSIEAWEFVLDRYPGIEEIGT